jgi:hypothetical protein
MTSLIFWKQLDVASGIVTSSPEMFRVFAPGPDEDYFKPDFFNPTGREYAW